MRADILGPAVRRAFATLVLMLGVVFFASSSRAQTPSPDDTLRAFHIAEQHIRDWSLPPEVAATDAKSDAPKAVGACITLKLRGEVIARGTAWSDSIAGPEAFSSRVLSQAIRAAMQQAEPKLGVANDAMRDQAIKLVTPDILISVELAGPLSAAEFATWDEAETSLRPGLDGVAVRIAPAGKEGGSPGPLHAIFPSQMMLSSMLPHRAMGSATAIALGEGGGAGALDDPKKLRNASGVRMYRFRVGQAVTSMGKAEPVLVARGQRLIAPGQIMTIAELRAMAAALANRLLDSPGGLPLESLLLARAAIDEYVDVQRTWPPELQNIPAGNGELTLASMTKDVELAKLPVTTLAIAALCHAEERSEVRCAFLGSLTRRKMDNGESSPAERGLLTFAEVRTHRWLVGKNTCGNPKIRTDEENTQRVRDALAKVPEQRIVDAMPWLGFSAVEVATGRSGHRSGDVPAALALRRMRDQCWAHQLSIADAGEDAMDMVGGIVFTGGLGDGKGGANPYPTWQCVRPLAFIATMLRDPRLTDAKERAREIVHLMQAMRFLRQLQVDEASAWMHPDPKLAIGAIRASTWDNSLPADATSMTLLCVVEMIRSLDELAKAPTQGGGVPAPRADEPPVPPR